MADGVPQEEQFTDEGAVLQKYLKCHKPITLGTCPSPQVTDNFCHHSSWWPSWEDSIGFLCPRPLSSCLSFPAPHPFSVPFGGTVAIGQVYWRQIIWVRVKARPLTSCAALDKLLYLSEPVSSSLRWGWSQDLSHGVVSVKWFVTCEVLRTVPGLW